MATKNFFVNDGLKVRGNTLLNGATYSDTALAKLHVKSAANGVAANLNNVNGLLIENSGSGNSNYAIKLATGAGNIFNISNAGNVGIGITTATSILHAVGPGAHPTSLAEFDTQSIARFEADSSTATSLYITEGADGSYLQVTDGATNSSTAKDLNLQPFGGNVGIGTTNPGHALEVSGASGTFGAIANRQLANDNASGIATVNYNAGNSSLRLWVDATGNRKINAGSTEVISFTTTAVDVKQPTTFSSGRATFSGTTGADGVVLAGGENNNLSSRLFFDNGTSGQAVTILNNSGGMEFRTAGTPGSSSGGVRMTLDSAGKLGIGTTDPNEKLTVVGNISASGNIYGNIADLEFTDLTVTGDLSVAGNSTFAAVTASSICNTGDITVTGDVEADEFVGALRGAVSFTAQAGEALSKGDVVYISGISGTQTVVAKADADDTSKMPAFGVASETVNLNANVTIYTFGTLSNVDTSLYPEGTELFVSTTAGGFLSAAPTGESAQIQKIAKVTRQHASSGSIKIMGAGRSNATPNLNEGRLFVGNSSNQAVADGTIHVDIANSLVGIGTTNPSRELEIQGAGNVYARVTASTDNDSAALELNNNGNELWTLKADDADGDYFKIRNNAGTALTIDTSKRVGVGTTDPGKTLHVYTSDDIISKFSSSDAGGRILINDTTTNAYINAASGVASIGQANGLSTSNVNILSSGNVGIGTTSPTNLLTVNGGAESIGVYFSTNPNPRLTIGADGTWNYFKGKSGQGHYFNTTGGAIFAIQNGGNVGIGTASPNEKLTVSGNISASGVVYADTFCSNSGSSSTIDFNDNLDVSGYINMAGGSSSRMCFNSLRWAEGSTSGTGQLTLAEDYALAQFRSDLCVCNDLTVAGNFTVHGTTTTLNTTVTATSAMCICNAGTGPALELNQTGTQPVIDLQDDGTSVFYIEDGGNVGIGTTSPGSKLHIDSGSGIGTIDGAYSLAIRGDGIDGIQILSDSAYQGRIVFGDQNSNTSGQIRYDHSTDAFRFFTNGTEKVSILSGGNFGVGNTNPDKLFVVQGADAEIAINDTNGTPQVRFRENGVTSALIEADTDLLFKVTDEKMRITSAGSVGIGTTSPDGKLEVSLAPTTSSTTVNETADFADKVVLSNSGTSANGDRIPLVFNIGGSGADNISTAIVGERESTGWKSALSFWVNNVTSGTEGTDAIQEGMRLNSDGNLGIGNAAPSFKLQVNGTVRINSGDAFLDDGQSIRWGGTAAKIDGSSGGDYLRFYTDGAERMRIISGGNVGIGTTSPTQKLHVVGAVKSTTYFTAETAANAAYFDHDGTNARITSKGADVDTLGGFKVLQQASDGFPSNTPIEVQIDGDVLLAQSSGNVGIGTTSPAYKLDIHGSFGSSAGAGLRLKSSATDDNGIIHEQADGTLWYTGQETSNPNDYEFWYYNGSNYSHIMHLDNSGSVGIGTTSPNAKLSIKGDTEFLDENTGVRIGLLYDNGTEGIFELRDNNVTKVNLRTAGASYFTGGSVGIGTNDPASVSQSPGLAVVHSGAGIATFDATGANGGYITITDSNTPLAYLGSSAQLISSGGTTTDAALRSNGELIFATNGNSERMRIDSAGNVGIGTTSPGATLDVRGDVRLDSGGNTDRTIYFRNQSSSTTVGGAIKSDQYLSLWAGNGLGTPAQYLTIKPAGNVGIGTASPSQKLHVHNGRIAVTDGYNIGDTDANTGMFVSSDYFYVQTAGTTRMTITSAGDVGIGTASPASKLDILGSTNSSLILTRTSSGIVSNIEDASGYGALALYQAGGGVKAYITGNGSSYFNGGNVGIGTTNPANPLDVLGKVSINTDGTLNWGNAKDYGRLTWDTGKAIVRGESGKALSLGANGAQDYIWIATSGNVGIGITDPDAKLEIALAAEGDYLIAGGDNASNTRALKFTSSTSNAGSNGAKHTLNALSTNGEIAFAINNSEKAIINKDGNVGIGTTSPDGNLTVQPPTGTANLDVFQTGSNVNCFDSKIRFQQSNGWQIEAKKYNANSNSGYDFGINYNRNQYAGDFYIANNGTKNLCLDSSGNLKVSSGQIQVVSGALSAPSFSFTNDTDTGFSRPTTNAINIVTAATERVRVDSAGKVGIGTQSPAHKVDIYSDENIPLRVHRPNNACLNSAEPFGIGFSTRGDNCCSTTDTRAGIFSHYNGALFLATDTSNVALDPISKSRLYINNAGKISINTTSPDPSHDLTIANTANYGIRFTGTNASICSNTNLIEGATNNIYMRPGSAYCAIIDSGCGLRVTSGNVGIGTASPAQKLNITDGGILMTDENAGQPMFQARNYATSATGTFDNTYGFEYRHASSGTQMHGALIHLNENNNSRRTLTVSSGLGTIAQFTSAFYVGIATANPKARMQVVTTSDTSGTPTTYDDNGKYFTVGQGGETGGNVFISYDNTNNRGYIGALSPSVAWRNLILNPGGGNIGIGTGTPERHLHVEDLGQIKLENNSTGNWAGIDLKTSGGTNDYTGYFGMLDSNGNFFIDVGSNGDDVIIRQNGETNIGLQGKVLVGLTTALNTANKLHVNNAIALGSSLYTFNQVIGNGANLELVSNANPANIGTNSNIIFKLGTSGGGGPNEAMRIVSTGNIGVGTTSPDAHLHVEKSAGETTVLTEVAANSTVGYEIKKTGSTTQHWKIVDGQTVNGRLEFYDATDSATRMTIDGAGNVGIGTVSPGGKLEISLPSGQQFKTCRSSNSYMTLAHGTGSTIICNGGTFQVQANGSTVTSFTVNSSLITLNEVVQACSQLRVCTTCAPTSNNFHVSSGITGSASKSSIAVVSVADNSTFYNGTAALHVINSGNRGTKGHSSGSDLLRLEFSDAIHTVFDRNGNVGIGTTAPGYELEVCGNVSACCVITGAVHERNLRTLEIKSSQEGTVLIWEDGKAKPCTEEYDSRVLGIAGDNSEDPIVMGAEPVLVTGTVNEGDFIVTSAKPGHGMAGSGGSAVLFGKVIAQALESGSGNSYTIKAMIRKL